MDGYISLVFIISQGWSKDCIRIYIAFFAVLFVLWQITLAQYANKKCLYIQLQLELTSKKYQTLGNHKTIWNRQLFVLFKACTTFCFFYVIV